MTVKELLALNPGIGRTTVYRWLHAGFLPARRWCGNWILDDESTLPVIRDMLRMRAMLERRSIPNTPGKEEE